MVKTETISLMITGGKATAGPPLAPALAGKGINIGQVVKDINEKTRDMEGMTVPVKVIVDLEEKKYEIEVGMPPSSTLLKKEAGVERGSSASGMKWVGDLKLKQVIKVAKTKDEALLGSDMKNKVKELVGTCLSLGIKVEEKHPKDVLKEINSGVYDRVIQAGDTELTEEEKRQLTDEKSKMKAELEALEKAAAAAAPEARAETTPETAEPAKAEEKKKPTATKAEKKPDRYRK